MHICHAINMISYHGNCPVCQGQRFTHKLAGLSTVISAQWVCHVVGSFYGEPTKYRDWIKSIEKYMFLAGGDEYKSKRLAYQTSRGAISNFIQRYMAEYPEHS